MNRLIGPVEVSGLTREAAVEAVVKSVITGTPMIFAFCNAHTVNLARASYEFKAALMQTTLLNDGVGLDIASKLLYGVPFPANLNGTDLTPAVLARLPTGTAVYLLGSRPAIAARAQTALSARFPDLRFVGSCDGYFSESDSERVVSTIRDSGAQLVLVGMGQPRQERWSVANRHKVGMPLMCIGAFLDFSAGVVPRAPNWVRAARAEWAFRLLIEPRRLARRYVVGNVSFVAHLLLQKLSRSC